MIKVDVSTRIEAPRPRLIQHTALVKHDDLPLTLAALSQIVVALNEKCPGDATVQIGHPHIYVYWQENG